MEDRLKDFINENRKEMDSLTPSVDLWTRIDAQIQTPVGKVKWTQKVWWKYLTAILVSTSLVWMALPNKPNTNQKLLLAEEIDKENLSLEEPIVLKKDSRQNLDIEPLRMKVDLSSKEIPDATRLKYKIYKEKPVKTNLSEPAKTPVKKEPKRVFKSLELEKLEGGKDTTFADIEKLTVLGSVCEIIFIEVPSEEEFVNIQYVFESVSCKKKKPIDYKMVYSLIGSNLEARMETSGKCITVDDGNRSVILIQVSKGCDKVSLQNNSGDISVNNFSGENFWAFSHGGDIELNAMQSEFQIQNTSGNIKGLNLVGNGKVSSTSGNIELETLKGNLKAQSTSGNIKIEQIHGDVTCTSTSGNIDVKKISESLTANSTSGNITVLNIDKELNIKTVSGDIEAHIIDGPSTLTSISGNILGINMHDFVSAKTTSGEVELENLSGNFLMKSTSGNLTVVNATLISGESNFATMTGTVKLSCSNPTSDLRLDLKSQISAIEINLKNLKLKVDNKLETGDGPVLIKGSTQTGDIFVTN